MRCVSLGGHTRALFPADRIRRVGRGGGGRGSRGGEGERTREGPWPSRDPGPQLTDLMGWGVGGAQQGWGERAERAQLNVGKTPPRYLGPISSLRNGTHVSPPHHPQSGLGEICPKSKELTGQELEA